MVMLSISFVNWKMFILFCELAFSLLNTANFIENSPPRLARRAIFFQYCHAFLFMYQLYIPIFNIMIVQIVIFGFVKRNLYSLEIRISSFGNGCYAWWIWIELRTSWHVTRLPMHGTDIAFYCPVQWNITMYACHNFFAHGYTNYIHDCEDILHIQSLLVWWCDLCLI